MADVLCEQIGQWGVITLNRPAALNALTAEMIDVMYQVLQDWQTDDAIHAVIIQAVPGRAFCAGGDIRVLHGLRGQTDVQIDFFTREYRLNGLIHAYAKPYVALMDGFTMGGGVGISLHGSHPVASERFVFAMPETSIGFFPDVGASYLLSRCTDGLGMYLGLTGARLDAIAALKAKLVQYVVPSSQFNDLFGALQTLDLSENPHQVIHDCINEWTFPSDEMPTAKLPDTTCFTKNSLAAIKQCVSQDVADILAKKSPFSLAITFSQLQAAKGLTCAECLEMDREIAKQFMVSEDLYEGIRAVLIDKDNAPVWRDVSSYE